MILHLALDQLAAWIPIIGVTKQLKIKQIYEIYKDKQNRQQQDLLFPYSFFNVIKCCWSR